MTLKGEPESSVPAASTWECPQERSRSPEGWNGSDFCVLIRSLSQCYQQVVFNKPCALYHEYWLQWLDLRLRSKDKASPLSWSKKDQETLARRA